MKSIHILLIEDNEGDILLTKEALAESKVINRITTIKDGSAAINFFETLSRERDKPDLVLLDINLPKRNGHEVLNYIKQSEKFSQLPVIMLTTSSTETDILSAYKNYVNCYITKPVDVAEFMSAITKVEEFWIKVVTIPLINN